MENKTQQNKTVVDFTNLKSLNQLISGNEINGFATSLKHAKQSLDDYCKNLKTKSNAINSATQPKPAEVKTVAEEKNQKSITPVVSAEVNNNNSDANKNTSNFSNQKPQNPNRTYNPNNGYNNQNGGYNNNYNKDRNNSYNNRPQGDRPNQTDRPAYQGNRNYNNQTDRPFNQNKPFNQGDRPYQNNRPFNQGDRQQPQGDRPFNRNNNGYSQNQNGFRPNNGTGFKPGFQTGQRPPFNKDAKDSPRPMGAKPFGPKSTFVPRGEVVSFTPKNDNSRKDKPKQKSFEPDKKGLNIKAKIRMGVVDFNEDSENENRIGRVRVKGKKLKQDFTPEKINIDHVIITTDNLTVKILSEKMGKPAAEIIKKFMLLGMMLNINSPIDYATAELVASEFGITLEQKLSQTAEEKLQENVLISGTELKKRPPIVTVMGHVDHGKTSLLDAIKKTNIISTEAGGITQHIGAYSVNVQNRKITFIDTPGHEAFTSMRARGAQITDIAILVVAADDGIMPQTVEAINHIKAANVPMIVAINKIDKPEANLERIKQQLTEHDVLPEEWGGDVICVPISAKNGTNIDKLLEMVLLVADMRDLKAYYDSPAVGTVVESKVDRGRGIIATVIIKEGILKIGDYLVCGLASGRVRAMTDYLGNSVKEAEPSVAVSVIGLDQVPDAGEMAYVVEEKLAKNILSERQTKVQEEKAKHNNGATLEDFLQQSADSELKVLKLIIKADVQGSSEAVKQSLEKIRNDEVMVKCIHCGVGSITESDVLLAKASNAIIIGFNIKPEIKAKTLAERNDVEIKLYKIIYEAVEQITDIISGMQAPKFEERILGHAEIRKIFKVSALGNIAGCYVTDGTIGRKNRIRIKRNGEEIAVVTIENLQQNKDDAKEVREGFECGIKLKAFNDIKELDILEAFEEVQIN